MKKMFSVWWQELVRLVMQVYIPIGLTIIFGMLAVTFWEDYALISTVIFLIVAFIVSDRIFKPKRSNKFTSKQFASLTRRLAYFESNSLNIPACIIETTNDENANEGYICCKVAGSDTHSITRVKI
ncbi:hypothetical protein D6T76_21480 [Enterobacter hormaechei]|nr:hypothetical protein D6T76_21480 [Enterobacter hormaechei]